MPKKIQRSLQDYISKMKKPRPHIPLPSHSRKWILSRCKHPKTLSFAVNQTRKPDNNANADANANANAATLSDVDRFLHENFKSLYLDDQESRTNDREPLGTGPVLFESPPPPDLCRPNRFLVEESRSSTSKSSSIQVPEQCIAVLTQSRSPMEDFRRSMEEVIEAKLQEEDNKIDWEYMEELLFCYLNMNDKKSYKYILSAFVDQIVVLREMAEEEAPARTRRDN